MTTTPLLAVEAIEVVLVGDVVVGQLITPGRLGLRRDRRGGRRRGHVVLGTGGNQKRGRERAHRGIARALASAMPACNPAKARDACRLVHGEEP